MLRDVAAIPTNALGRPDMVICGYRIDDDDVVFDFDPQVFSMWIDSNAEVMVAGEFNNWLDNDGNGHVTGNFPQWAMQRVEDNHYTLHKKIADFQSKPKWQFKFVVNRNEWTEVPNTAKNRDESDGFLNLLLMIPPPVTNTVTVTKGN